MFTVSKVSESDRENEAAINMAWSGFLFRVEFLLLLCFPFLYEAQGKQAQPCIDVGCIDEGVFVENGSTRKNFVEKAFGQ